MPVCEHQLTSYDDVNAKQQDAFSFSWAINLLWITSWFSSASLFGCPAMLWVCFCRRYVHYGQTGSEPASDIFKNFCMSAALGAVSTGDWPKLVPQALNRQKMLDGRFLGSGWIGMFPHNVVVFVKDSKVLLHIVQTYLLNLSPRSMLWSSGIVCNLWSCLVILHSWTF